MPGGSDAHGIPDVAVHNRAEVMPAVEQSRRTNGPFLINFHLEKEDAVYPMIAPGSALDEMIQQMPAIGQHRRAATAIASLHASGSVVEQWVSLPRFSP